MSVADRQIGILLPTRGMLLRANRERQVLDPEPIFRLAARAEKDGLDSVWVGDSLVSKPRLDPVSTLAALAVRTTRLGLGTAVLLPALRRPAPLAHSLATIDLMARGRLTIAAGVGGAFTAGQQQDWLAAGISPKTRASRLEETVQVMKRLWTEDRASFHGRHFQLEDVTLLPKPPRPGGVPVLLATHSRTGSDRQIRRAASVADGIVGITDPPDEAKAVFERVSETAGRMGRDASQLVHAFYMTVHIGDDRTRAEAEAEAFLLDYYGVRHWGDRWGPWGSPREIADKMDAYFEAGVHHLIVRFAAWDQEAQLARFTSEVAPRLAPA